MFEFAVVPSSSAVSLHATTNATRDRIAPVNRKYPLKRRNRITFEYVLLDGVNDTPEDARRLVRLLGDIKAKVNLLPLNAHARGKSLARRARRGLGAFGAQGVRTRGRFRTPACPRRRCGVDREAASGGAPAVDRAASDAAR